MSAAEDAWQAGRRAWERLAGWLRDEPGVKPGHPDSGDAAVDALDDIGVVRRLLDQAELVAVRVPQLVSEEILSRAARKLRRRSNAIVPNVVGMTWDDARDVLRDKGLIGMSPDPEGPPLAALGWPNAVVTDQSPESGARVRIGSTVTLWLERGGGSAGVREPRRPKPTPGSGREWRPEPADEAVG